MVKTQSNLQIKWKTVGGKDSVKPSDTVETVGGKDSVKSSDIMEIVDGKDSVKPSDIMETVGGKDSLKTIRYGLILDMGWHYGRFL